MTGYEDQLHARAEMLGDTGDLAAEARGILDAAAGAGLDPAAAGGLRRAFTALDPAGTIPGYDAGCKTDREPGAGYRSDAEFLEAVSEAAEEVRERARETGNLQDQCAAAMDKALDNLDRARRDREAAQQALAAAYALPVKAPCDGCHGAKRAAIAEAETAVRDADERIQDATKRTGLLDDATDLLDGLAARLETALAALRMVPVALGEVYELVYAFVAAGGKLPRYGRWIEGEG